MLIRPTTLSWRATLSIRNPHSHVHQARQVAATRRRGTWMQRGKVSNGDKSVSPPDNLVQPGQPRADLPDSDLTLTDPRELAAKHGLKTKGKFQGAKDGRARQGTIEVLRPGNTSQEQVLKAFNERFRMTHKYWQNFSKHPEQALIILATPSFAKWLEDDSFIGSVLDCVTRGIARGEARKKPEARIKKRTYKAFEMDVLCACVDGLSPDVDWLPHAIGHRAREGFSILQGRTPEILPNLWENEGPIVTKSQTMTASLTFANTASAQNQTDLVLPLANTLFSNGRHSTLVISKWRATKDSFVRSAVSHKNDQMIRAFDLLEPADAPAISVPATPLTPARRIVSGLGNIVKQIDYGEDGAGPASRELEATIDEYLLQTQTEKSTIAVWALIIPKCQIQIRKSQSQFELLQGTDRVRAHWLVMSPDTSFVGFWLGRGAKFCRILSGGGGWGVKQGLLSLDPQTTFSEINEARFDFWTGSIEDQQTSALGRIAEEGDFIQFFVANKTGPTVKSLPDFGVTHGNIWRRATVIGTVPSTIDDQKLGDAGPPKKSIIIKPGHFGAVSESGIFFSASQEKEASSNYKTNENSPTNTKVDLPYSYVYRDMRALGPAAEQMTLPAEKNATRKQGNSNVASIAPSFKIKKVWTKGPEAKVEVPPDYSHGLDPQGYVNHLGRTKDYASTVRSGEDPRLPFRVRKYSYVSSFYETPPFPKEKHLVGFDQSADSASQQEVIPSKISPVPTRQGEPDRVDAEESEPSLKIKWTKTPGYPRERPRQDPDRAEAGGTEQALKIRKTKTNPKKNNTN